MDQPSIAIPEIDAAGSLDAAAEALRAFRPMVLRGLARHWPAVSAARASNAELTRHIAGFDRGEAVEAFVGHPEIAGRFFYGETLGEFNFRKQQARVTDFLDYLLGDGAKDDAPSVYIGAAVVPQHLPGFDAVNAMPLLNTKRTVPRIWIGNRTTVSTHFDTSDNIACVIAGRRRFVVFPPDQLPNLYVGPLDHTLAGQPSSMVSLLEPDFERFPRFREALDAAMVAELEPGDAIYVPTLWWHHVDALTPFNILVNYWWDDAPPDAGSPFEAMAHGIMAISQLSPERRDAWRAMFAHYVFRDNGDPAAHLPPKHRGILDPSTPEVRARMTQFLLRALAKPR